MKYVEIVFAATVVGALVGCAGQPAALDPDAKAVTPAPLALKVWPGSDNAVQFANEKPLQFSADATAAEKVFSVLGMPSFQAVRAGAFSIQAVQKTSAEQTQQNISSIARQAPANRNAAELAAFNALGGNVGAAGLAVTVLGSSSFDPRTEIGTFVCFEPKSGTKDFAAAVQSCGNKLLGMVERTFEPIRADEKSTTARRFIGPVATETGKKIAQLYVNTEGVFVGDGYAPVDRGAYPATVVAIGFDALVAEGFGKRMGWVVGDVGPVDLGNALGRNLPRNTAFFLPNRETPIAFY